MSKGREGRGATTGRAKGSGAQRSIGAGTLGTICVFLALWAPSASAAPPKVTSTSFSAVATTSATLKAEVNPEGNTAQARFEYGPADCATIICAKTQNVAVGSGASPVEVPPVTVESLTPGTTYHFRVVVPSTGGTTTGPDTTFTTFAQAQAFGPCANDAFRTAPPQPSATLPDCRAYEQASPVDKNGLDARARVFYARAAIDGGAIGFTPAGGIPGAEGAQDIPTYLASRVGGNWSTQGLLPSASLGEEAFILGWTPDFSESFAAASKFNGVGGNTLVARASAAGAPSTIVAYGEGLGDVRYASASADGSKVLFESKSKLTGVPGALEGKPNLYLWDRDTNKIGLAGVLNSEAPPPAGTFAGPYDWAVSGSTETGGPKAKYYAQDEHVVSANGSKIWFTAAKTGQIYLRQNPLQSQSKLNEKGECVIEASKACTVNISASRKTNGKGPNGTDPAGAQPAALMEATPDGSAAFFTSSEKLTNDANTGPELTPPAIALAKSADGGEKNLSLLPAVAKGIAVDSNFIYWADPGQGVIGRAELDGGNPQPEFIVNAGKPQYVTVDGGHVYWTDVGDGGKEHGTIRRSELGGGNPETIVTGATNPQGIDAEGEFLYWGNAGEEDATRTIGQAKLDGEGVNEAFIELGEGPQKETPQGVVVDATHLYVVTNGTEANSYISRFDLADPKVHNFLFDGKGTDIKGIAVDAGHVYWARQGADSIGQANLELKEANFEFIKEASRPLGLAVGNEHLYWSANQESPPNPGNDLYRYDVGTGKLSDVAPLATKNGAEVVGMLGSSTDGSTVYFVANGDLDGAGPAQAGECKKQGGSFNYSGQCSLYVVRDGNLAVFVARLDAGNEDSFNWLPMAASGQRQRTARVSASGDTLLFSSLGQLTTYKNKKIPELYRYRQGEGIICVSCNPTGEAPTEAPDLGSITLSATFPFESNYTLSRNLSADGNRAFFETTDALVGADINGQGGCPTVGPPLGTYRICLDAYEWEAAGTGSCPISEKGGGCIYLLSNGKSTDASYILDASASGNDVFIATREPFVRQDKDQLYDVYGAVVEGGLASQNQVPNICESRNSCHPATPAPTTFESPGTASFSGPGNAKPKQPKKSHHKKSHHRKKHKRANANRRAGR